SGVTCSTKVVVPLPPENEVAAEPPLTWTSLAVNPVTASVKLIVTAKAPEAVPPGSSIVGVGASRSYCCETCDAAVFGLPAASSATPAGTPTVKLPSDPAGGVTTSV